MFNVSYINRATKQRKHCKENFPCRETALAFCSRVKSTFKNLRVVHPDGTEERFPPVPEATEVGTTPKRVSKQGHPRR